MLVNRTQSIISDEYMTVAIAPSEQPISDVAWTIASALYKAEQSIAENYSIATLKRLELNRFQS